MMGEKKYLGGRKPYAKIIGGSFPSFSISLREDNARVSPTYFQWNVGLGSDFDTVFYCDGGMMFRKPLSIKSDTKFVCLLVEPRALHPENYTYIEENHQYFDHVLTYDKELLDTIPNGLYYALGGSSIAFEDWGLYRKSKNICMITSGKDTTPGHRMRAEIVEHFEGEIDFYGAGVGKPFDRKFDILKDYKYCVVVESDLSTGYFSEKLIDAVSVGCIPLHYCARGNYSNVYISKHIFTTLEELDDLLICIRNNMLYSDIDQLERNIESAQKFRIAEDFIFETHQELFI